MNDQVNQSDQVSTEAKRGRNAFGGFSYCWCPLRWL